MEVTPSSTRLGCGRDIDDVWENVPNAPTPHEVTCPDCQAARADLAGLAAATKDLHHDDTVDTELQTSPQVIDRILTVARAEVRRGRRLPLRRPGPDQTSDLTVSEQAVATMIRRVGDQSPAIQIRRCAITLITDEPSTPQPGDESSPTFVRTDADPHDDELAQVASAVTPVDQRPGPAANVRVALRVSVGSAVSIVGLVDALRMMIIDAIHRDVGMNVVGVDVAVEDLHD